tara:strand:- start:10260 stop:10529 length:270 start_codon:yes stop_codon:yes gene_type:complete
MSNVKGSTPQRASTDQTKIWRRVGFLVSIDGVWIEQNEEKLLTDKPKSIKIDVHRTQDLEEDIKTAEKILNSRLRYKLNCTYKHKTPMG